MFESSDMVGAFLLGILAGALPLVLVVFSKPNGTDLAERCLAWSEELLDKLTKERAVKCNLLAMCKRMLSVAKTMNMHPKVGDWNWPQLENDLEAAIAKAEGRPS